MNTAQQGTPKKEHLSGYELTYKTIKNLAQYDITPTAKLVLVLLTTHYNAGKNGAVIFPSMPTIADTLGIGLTATKKAIKDLIEAGAIIKAKRDRVRGNCNKYALTSKVLKATFKQSKSELFKRSENDRFMSTSNPNWNNQSSSEPQKNENPQKKNEIVIDFSLKSQKKQHHRVTLDEVAESIKNNSKIKNPCAYWATLKEEERKAIFDREKAEKEKTAREEKLKQDEEARRERERAEQEAWNALPVYEKYTKEKAIRYLHSMRHFYLKHKQLNAFTLEFVDYYALNPDLICKMTAQELETFITENC